MMNIKATYPKQESTQKPLHGTVTTYNLYDYPLPTKAWETVINAHVDVLRASKWEVSL